MKGLRKLAVGDASLIVLESVTDEIKDALKNRLAEYFYGRVHKENPEFHSYENTVEEFFRIYDSKALNTRTGLAGELVVHLLLGQGHERLESACLYANKEENNIKKGFDLTFRDREDGGIWYGEVKSGVPGEGIQADEKVQERIGEAERSLNSMFTSDVERKRWSAALLDAELTLESSKSYTVKELLRADSTAAEQGRKPEVRALLCAVIMHPFDLSEITAEFGNELLRNVQGRKRFKQTRLFVIQQADLEVLVSVLRDVTRFKANEY